MKRTPPPGNSLTPTDQPSQSITKKDEAEETVDPINPKVVAEETIKPEPLTVPAILLEGDEPSEKPRGPHHQGHGTVEKERTQDGVLPESYGTGRLMLTARDPHCLYAHWDFSAAQQNQYNELSESRTLQLKVYRNTVGGPLISEEPVGSESNHLFVSVDAAGRYVAELGYYPTGGAWKAIATSEPANTPMEVIAPEEPVRFATLTFRPKRTVESVMPETIAQPTELPAITPSPVQEILPQFPLPRYWRGTAAGAMGPVEEEESILPVLLKPQDRAEKLSSRNEVELMPGSTASETAVEEQWMIIEAPVPGEGWTEEQKQKLEELSGWSSSRRRQIGSAEIEELMRARAREIQLGLGPESLAEEISISSLGVVGAPPEERRRFWFSVNAELVIYGATEPNAAVTIAGRRIRLRPDGTFSYRFSLPDGSYQLPMAARSAHGEVREAELSFYRGTRYGGEVNALVLNAELKPPVVENVD